MELAVSFLAATVVALLLAVANGSSEVQVMAHEERSSGGDRVVSGSGYMGSSTDLVSDPADPASSFQRALLSESTYNPYNGYYKDQLKKEKARHHRKIKGKRFRRGRKSPPPAAYKPLKSPAPPPYKAPKPTKSAPPPPAPYKAPRPRKSPPPYKAPKPTKSPSPPSYKPSPPPANVNRYYYRPSRSPPPPALRPLPTPSSSRSTTSATQQAYLAPHNAARAKKYLPPLSWDPSLEAYARNWGNHQKNTANCALSHSSGPYGENLFWGWGKAWSPADAVQSWVEEEQYYDYASDTCASGQMCGHYTQVVWRSTTKLGCASINCNDGSTFIICSYNPPGNYVGEKPY